MIHIRAAEHHSRGLRIFVNGREQRLVTRAVCLWNGGPGFVEKACRDHRGGMFLDLDNPDRIATSTLLGLVRVEGLR